jgi:large subunit ribosomal protein L24
MPRKVVKHTKSSHPRKQRRAHYNAPLHKRRKDIAGHLSKELRLRYHRRSFSIRKDDVVQVVRGSYKGHNGKVVKVDSVHRKIHVEGATYAKADGTQVAKPLDPSNVLITQLELSDPYRNAILDRKEEVQ